MPADVFRRGSNMDRTCVGQQQLHRRQEFYGVLNDTTAAPQLTQCVVVDYIEIVPSTVEVQGVILAECALTHCPDIGNLCANNSTS